MEKYNIHKKSLELLDQLIASSPEVLKDLMKKHENTIAGPTYSEYMYSLNEDENSLIEYIQCDPGDEWLEILISQQVVYYSPPQNLIKKDKKKDSAMQSLSFFV